ncbi:hypothetical protein D3C72_1375180 [compost metagenome]
MELWPKGQLFAKPGILTLHVGPVHKPAPIEEIYAAYREWVLTINPEAFPAETAEKPATEAANEFESKS